MGWLDEFRRRLSVLFRRERFDRELDEEMRFHLEVQAEENQERGMDAEEACHAARRQFGNATLLKEVSRESHPRISRRLGFRWCKGVHSPTMIVKAHQR